MEDEDIRHESDIDGAPIEDLDGLPLDSKEVEIKTIDGKPLVEDVDGDSYTEELDGAPCKWINPQYLVPTSSKWQRFIIPSTFQVAEVYTT